MSDKISFSQCELLAQREGYDSATFDLCGPSGRKSCKWEDAYMGTLEVEGKLIFVGDTMKLLPIDKLWCENFNSGK